MNKLLFLAGLAASSPAIAGNTQASTSSYRAAGAKGHYYGRSDALFQDTTAQSLVTVSNGQPIAWLGQGFNESFGEGAVGTTTGIQCNFYSGLAFETNGGGGANGANICQLADGFNFQQWPLITTSTAPVLTAANGLDIMGAPNSSFLYGMELVAMMGGLGAGANAGGRPYQVGVDPDFYTCATLKTATYNGNTIMGIGLRDPETEIYTYVTYADYISIADYADAVKTDTNYASAGHTLGSATTTFTSTTGVLAHTYCISVMSATGIATTWLDGISQATSSALTAGQLFVPYVINKQNATTTPHVYLTNWKAGWCPLSGIC